AEPVHLPRTDQVDSQSDGNAATTSSRRAAHLGHELILDRLAHCKGGPHLENAKIRPISRLISAGATTVQDCFGQQWSVFGHHISHPQRWPHPIREPPPEPAQPNYPA